MGDMPADRGEVITLPTTPQAFTPITGSKNEGWGLLKKIYDGGWKSQYYRQLPFRIRHIYAHSLKKPDMLLMQIYVRWHPTVSVRMPITVLTLPIHSVSPGELQKRTS